MRVTKYHDISAGHRVIGQKGKCERSYHGHNYRFYFTIEATTDKDIGMTLDFNKIGILSDWVEQNWDHKTILWNQDPNIDFFKKVTPDGIWIGDFNPTAENMITYLLDVVGPDLLKKYGDAKLVKVKIEETRKCSAEDER